MASSDRFRLEVFLVTGQSIVCEISDKEALEEVERRSFVWPPGMTEEQRPMTVIFTVNAQALQERGDRLSIFVDVENRVWAVRPTSIVAFNLLDREAAAGRSVGFTPPVLGQAEVAEKA